AFFVGGNDEVRALVKSCVPDVKLTASADEAAAVLAALRTDGVRRSVAIVHEKICDATDDSTFSRLAGEDLACAPAFILLTDDPGEGLPTGIVRSRFVTTLATPLDPVTLAAGLRIARGNYAAERPDHARAGAFVAPSRPLSILVAEDNRTNQKVVAKI